MQLDAGFAAHDAAGEAADFVGADGVDQAEAGVVDVVFRQGLREHFEPVFVLQQLFGFGQQHFAGAGEGHAAVGAGKQRRADVGFERLDLGGNGGLGKKQLFGGLGKVLGVGDGDKGAQLVDVHVGSVSSGVLTISVAAVFLAKNARLPRQKCSQGVQPCCAFFLAFGHFLLKKPLRKPNVNTP